VRCAHALSKAGFGALRPYILILFDIVLGFSISGQTRYYRQQSWHSTQNVMKSRIFPLFMLNRAGEEAKSHISKAISTCLFISLNGAKSLSDGSP